MNNRLPLPLGTSWDDLLENYRRLVDLVDGLCQRINQEFSEHLVCRAGCDACCKHITLFPVETAALSLALHDLPPDHLATIQEQARTSTPDGPCPLLVNGCCQLYPSRPLICRTHGLPLLTGAPADRQIDFCPRNFVGIATLPGSAVIDLDRLNELLVAINTVFSAGNPAFSSAAQRFTIAEALLLDLPPRT